MKYLIKIQILFMVFLFASSNLKFLDKSENSIDESLNKKIRNLFDQLDIQSKEVAHTHLYELAKYMSGKNKKVSSKGFICNTCGKLFDLLKSWDYPTTKKVLSFIVAEICTIAKLFVKEVCFGAVKEMTGPFTESLGSKIFDKEKACPAMGLCPNVYEEINIQELKQEILKDKPSNFTEFYNTNIPKKILSFLQISDLHTDLEYQQGSVANCDEPICCRPESHLPHGSKDKIIKSSKWGSYASCDLPPATLEQFINYVKNNIAPDFGIWTGDNTSHDIWHQSYKKNEENTKNITRMFMNDFNFSIYPSIGNHESFPVNIYDFTSNREDEFKQFFSHEWEKWIGAEAALELQKNSFYSTYNKEYNLKIIALNSQACNNENFYLIKDPTDPGGMLNWMREQLYEAEKNKKFVYILSHYPNHDCLSDYAQIFDALVERFSFNIRGVFVGHSHNDGIQFFRDSKTNEIINVSFMTPSLTTYTFRSPSFRVIQVNPLTMRPINYHQYRLNLTKWNELESDNLEFDLAYTFVEEYGLKDFSFESLAVFTEKLRTDQETINKFAYNRRSGRDSDLNRSRKKGIDISYYCGTYTTPLAQSYCKNPSYKQSWGDWFFDKLRGQWKKRIQ